MRVHIKKIEWKCKRCQMVWTEETDEISDYYSATTSVISHECTKGHPVHGVAVVRGMEADEAEELVPGDTE